MTELLQSIRTDLLSRRLLPIAALALLALVVGIGYALGGGSGASTPPPPVAPASPPGGNALAVAVAAPNPNQAVAETPGGLRYQSHGPTRDPFKPLVSTQTSAVSTARSASKAASVSSGSQKGAKGAGKAGGSGSGSGKPALAPTPAKPGKPAKPAFPYVVSVLFGRLPTAPGQAVTLPPYQSLRPGQPLPSASDPRIALERVSPNGKSAVFALLAPPILHGAGVCLPSASECQSLALAVGRSEELEYLEPSGQALVYELKTVSIAKGSSLAAG